MSDRFFSRFLRGWREIGVRLGTALGLLVICGFLGAAVSLPLWFLSTTYRSAYTIGVAAAAGASIAVWAVRRLARPGRAGAGAPPLSMRRRGRARLPRGLARLFRALSALAKAALLLAALGATFALALRGRFLAALPAAAAFFAVVAWIGLGAGSRKAP